MTKTLGRALAILLALTLVTAACTEDDGADGDDGGAAPGSPTAAAGDTAHRDSDDAAIDYAGLGLWDDGPCDEARAPLVVGTMAVFETATLSLIDQVHALEASAEAFNGRGGANGACIQVHACDDGGNPDQSLACVREVDEAGVVATVNDTGTAAQTDVSAAMAAARIPRVANNVTPSDWADPNSFPMGSGTAVTLLMPKGVIEAGARQLGIVRIDQPAASALIGLLEAVYAEDGATVVADLPVPAGTTDYSQFILSAEDAGADAITMAIGQLEGIQIMRAAQQLSSDLLVGAAPIPWSTVADLGDFAEQLVFVQNSLPATSDLPVYTAMRDDLAASGETNLEAENLTSQSIASWVSLYALIRMIRDVGMQEFTRESITAMLQAAVDVPMLGIFGDENWTPDLNRPAVFQRAGIDRMGVYRWDPTSTAAGFDGNFVETAVVSFDEVLCGSALGAPEPC